MFGGSPEINHRLRSEKSHQQLGRRGFDSRHLHHFVHGLTRAFAQRAWTSDTRATHDAATDAF
jgi:hypothetical protein